MPLRNGSQPKKNDTKRKSKQPIQNAKEELPPKAQKDVTAIKLTMPTI